MLKRFRPNGTRYLVTPTWAYFGLAFLVLAAAAAATPSRLPGLLVGCGFVLACSPFFVRSGIYVTPSGVRYVPVSGTSGYYEWSSVQRSKIALANQRLGRSFGIYLQRADGLWDLLPGSLGPRTLLPKIERTYLSLEQARQHAHALCPPVASPSTPHEAQADQTSLSQKLFGSREMKLAFIALTGGAIVCFVAALIYS